MRKRDDKFKKNLEDDANKVSELKGLALDFNKEAKAQVVLTEKLNQRVENTEIKMKKIDSKLDHFIANSSDRKVWIYIAI